MDFTDGFYLALLTIVINYDVIMDLWDTFGNNCDVIIGSSYYDVKTLRHNSPSVPSRRSRWRQDEHNDVPAVLYPLLLPSRPDPLPTVPLHCQQRDPPTASQAVPCRTGRTKEEPRAWSQWTRSRSWFQSY